MTTGLLQAPARKLTPGVQFLRQCNKSKALAQIIMPETIAALTSSEFESATRLRQSSTRHSSK
jgi:hypothetical protein